MARLTLRIITGLLTFVLGLLAWMVFVFASPAETLDTPYRGSAQQIRADVPPPPKPHGCPSRHR